MTTDPQRSEDEARSGTTDDASEGGTVSEASANPVPPETTTLASEDVHDSPQSPTRPDVAEDDRQPD
ncbi:hypothetical protein [Aeromicrobium flavum]|uniref:hypothetical protein n=1 Tax=Aeromicrobium flavum TaxID=416568 RepID=UPI0031D19939